MLTVIANCQMQPLVQCLSNSPHMEVWMFVFVIGVVCVLAQYQFIQTMSQDPNSPWLSDTTWLCEHLTGFLILGALLPYPVIDSFLAIVAWESLERVLGTWWPQQFLESNEKFVLDVIFSTVGYAIGHWLRRQLLFVA